jgi:hypothetical protein
MRVDLPAGAEVLEAPANAVIADGKVRLEAELSSDLELLIRYALEDGAT